MPILTPAEARANGDAIREQNTNALMNLGAKMRNDVQLDKIANNGMQKVLQGHSEQHTWYLGGDATATTAQSTDITIFSTSNAQFSFVVTQISAFMLGELGEAGFPIDLTGKALQEATIHIKAGKREWEYPLINFLNVALSVPDATTGIEATNGQARSLNGSFNEPLAFIAEGDNVEIKIKGQTAVTITATQAAAIVLAGQEHVPV